MRIIYSNSKVEQQCTSIKTATKLFGGDKKMALSLQSRIFAIQNADVIKDIIVMKPFRFHQLKGSLKGYFAIDVKTGRDKWRIILRPLDENKNVFDPCNIDEIAGIVRIVEIREVSAPYE